MYVGYATVIYERISRHKRELINKCHDNQRLQNAVNVYGIENFKFEKLVNCEVRLLASEEHYWCNLLRVHDDKYGYNIRPTDPNGRVLMAESSKQLIRKARTGTTQPLSVSKKISKENMGNLYALRYTHTLESLNKMSNTHKRKVIQYTKEDEFVKEWDSAREAAKVLNINAEGISGVVRNVKHNLTAGGYKWKYAPFIEIKTLIQESQDGLFIAEWESIAKAARETNITPQGISRCCTGRLISSGGYRWRYKIVV